MIQIPFFITVYVALVFQVELRDPLLIGTAAPDFLALLVAAALFLHQQRTALVWTAVIGLLMDAIATGPLGISMLVCTGVALIVQLRPGVSRRSSAMALAVYSGLIVFAILWASEGARMVLAGRPVEPLAFSLACAGSALYSGCVGLAALLVGRILRRLTPWRTSRNDIHSARHRMLTD